MNTKKTTKKLPSWLVRLIIAGALLIFTGAVWLLASKVPLLFFPWYREFSKGLMTVLSTVMGVVPVALWDFGEVALILLLIVFEQDFSVFHVAHRAAILDWLVVSLRWMVGPMAAGAPTW